MDLSRQKKVLSIANQGGAGPKYSILVIESLGRETLLFKIEGTPDVVLLRWDCISRLRDELDDFLKADEGAEPCPVKGSLT